LLGLVLARPADPALIALDGLDDGLDATEQEALRSRLAEISGSGTAVVLTARSVDPAHVAKVVRLGALPAGVSSENMPTAGAAAAHSPARVGVGVEL
jgi:ABC-2 type transport system ATP-binding protein